MYRNQRHVWVTLVWCGSSPDTQGCLEISPTLPSLDSKKALRAPLWQAVINVTTTNSFSYGQKAHHPAGNTHSRPAKVLLRVKQLLQIDMYYGILGGELLWGGKMYIVNFHEGLKCLNLYRLAIKSSFWDHECQGFFFLYYSCCISHRTECKNY